MSGSALYTSGIAVPPIPSAFTGSRYGAVAMKPATRPVGGGGGGGGLLIECSSRPKKKATAHHKKTRPRKTQQWDIKRKPTVYAPLPPMPPEWTLVTGEDFPQTPTATQTLQSASEQ